MYCLIGGVAGFRAGLVVENLDSQQFTVIRGMVPTLAQFGVMLGFTAAGELLAQQVVRHLPSQAPDRVRVSWVGSVPVGLPSVAAHAVLPLFQLVVQTLAGRASLGVMLALVLGLWSYWQIGRTDVAVTSSDIRITFGANTPFPSTSTLRLADVVHVEIVQVSTARSVMAAFSGGFAYRRGPALRVHHHDPAKLRTSWLLGMPGPDQAEQAATVIRSYRATTTTA